MKNLKISQRPISIAKSPHLKEDGLSEIYQSMAVKMAILTRQGPGEFTRITPYVLCRDFLVDVYSFSRAKKGFEIYGCKFDPSLDTPQRDGVFLSLIFPKNDVQASFEKNLDHLHTIELANDLTPTEYIPLEDQPKTAVIVADKGWLMNCLTVSLYTSLLRIFCYSIDGDGWIPQMKERYREKTDGALVHSVADETWERALSNIQELKTPDFCGFDPEKEEMFTIHHNSGFFSVFGTHRELSVSLLNKNKHYGLFKEAGWKLYAHK